MLNNLYDSKKCFEYENGYYLTADVNRFSKFASHYEFFKMSSNIRGEIVECGVFKGASLAKWVKFRELLENKYSRKIIAFDTFGKFPDAHYEKDKVQRNKFIQEAGDSSISLKQLTSLLDGLSLNSNIELVEGDILETVPQYTIDNPQLKISLLHVDVDLYEPTKVILDELYPHVANGGVIVFDDYGAFAGANKAVDEYFKENVVIKKLPFSDSIGYIIK
jgi:hypothetical protein